MQSPTKALLVGVVAGLVLLSLVVSMDFVYVAPRTAVAYIVNDAGANIALIPNNNHLESQKGYFAFLNAEGDLEINFGNVAPSTTESLSDVFYIQNNLNEPVSVSITVQNPSGATLTVSSTSFTLQPGQKVPITLTLSVGSVSPGTQLTFTITITATYGND